MRKLTLLSFFVALSLLLSSCSMHLGLSKLIPGGSSSKGTPGASTVKATHTPPAPVTAISIKNGKFRPKNPTIKVGTTLTWTNDDDIEQTVTSDSPGVFDSGALAPGASWKFTFNAAGVFPYHSKGKNGSFGSITVTQ